MSVHASGLPWSAQQQHWLSAMGYTLYATGPVEAPADVEPEDTQAHATAEAVAPAAEPPRPATPRPSTPRMRTAARLPDRLHFALIRASGCNPNAEGAADLFAQWPSSAELRGNPAAKRALWPTLRALRRQALK